ncbi:hypothetical protein PG997_010040 [Apiospora hydei]|uniref:Uncharacterized protein n=1 Tax=Apiospora hydei TaxID=1337664 RepID=A0ABR1VVX4_9PEZI
MAEDKNNTHYFLDLSADEDERLKLGQLVILDHMEKAVWAPLDLSVPGLRILDSATASGVWLQDLKASLPASSNHTYIGTDITPIYFVKTASPDLTLQVQSMKQPWPTEWQGTFDLRGEGRSEAKGTIANMMHLLKPGGWMQLVESDHSVVQGPALQSMFELLCDKFKVMDTGPDYAPQLEDWFKELGMVNIGCRIFDVPLGANNPNEEMKAKSTRCFFLATNGMAQAAQSVPTSFAPHDLGQLASRVEEELATQGGCTGCTAFGASGRSRYNWSSAG